MTNPECASAWKQVTSEFLWGRRGIVKVMNLWLPLALITSVSCSDSGEGGWRTCFQVFTAVLCWSLASILINDLADRDADRTAGKCRWVGGLSVRAGVATAVVLCTLGILMVVLAGANKQALAAYLGAVLLGLFYSVRPVRLKGRGVLGPLGYSLSCTLAFAVLPGLWLGANWQTLVVLAVAVLLDKWVNLHFHQVVDYESDRIANTRSFAVVVGLRPARVTLKVVGWLSSASLVAVLVFLALEEPEWGAGIAAICVAVALAVAVYVARARQHPDRASPLVRELPSAYLGLTYADFRILPLMLFARLALQEPGMWAVVCLVGMLVVVESIHAVQGGSD